MPLGKAAMFFTHCMQNFFIIVSDMFGSNLLKPHVLEMVHGRYLQTLVECDLGVCLAWFSS